MCVVEKPSSVAHLERKYLAQSSEKIPDQIRKDTEGMNPVRRNLNFVFGEMGKIESGRETDPNNQGLDRPNMVRDDVRTKNTDSNAGQHIGDIKSGTQVTDSIESIIGAVKFDGLGPRKVIGTDLESLEMDVDIGGPSQKEGYENKDDYKQEYMEGHMGREDNDQSKGLEDGDDVEYQEDD
ncbi:hypothetical protein Q3G72_016935 [Acer saccharum]|nr:hypothetical protein Q3G72_016935 [Acer saccharum]